MGVLFSAYSSNGSPILMDHRGDWDANTNTPTLASSAGSIGESYIVSVAGATSLDGESSWNVGDNVYFDGSVWNKVFAPGTGVGGGGVSGSGTTNRMVMWTGATAVGDSAFNQSGTSFLPVSNNSQNLGSSSYSWSNLFTGVVQSVNDLVVVAGAGNTIINNILSTGDLILQSNSSEWLRFDTSASSLTFVSNAAITTSGIGTNISLAPKNSGNILVYTNTNVDQYARFDGSTRSLVVSDNSSSTVPAASQRLVLESGVGVSCAIRMISNEVNDSLIVSEVSGDMYMRVPQGIGFRTNSSGVDTLNVSKTGDITVGTNFAKIQWGTNANRPYIDADTAASGNVNFNSRGGYTWSVDSAQLMDLTSAGTIVLNNSSLIEFGGIDSNISGNASTGVLAIKTAGTAADTNGITLNVGLSADISIIHNGGNWFTFDTSANDMVYPNGGSLSAANGSLSLACSTGNNVFISKGTTNVFTFDVGASSVSAASLSLVASSGDLTLSTPVGAADIILGSENDVVFKSKGTIYAAFDNSVSSNPLVLAGSNSAAGVASVGVQLYIEGLGASTTGIAEFVNTNTLSGITSGRILNLQFSNRSNPDTAQRFIDFRDSSGSIGYIAGDGAGAVLYQTFTGGHSGHMEGDTGKDTVGFYNIIEGTKTYYEPGMILVSSGRRSINGYSVYVQVADKDGQKSVMGVFASYEDDHHMSKYEGSKAVVTYKALGDGEIIVTNKNGKIQNGDLIESSSIPGYGQLQGDDIFRSKTVAKCTQNIDWESISQYVSHNGTMYKKAKVSCTYHCG